MNLTRRGEYVVIETTMRDFLQDYRAATPEQYVVLDGRPGVFTNADRTTVVTPYPALWELYKRTRTVTPSKRERRCTSCGAILDLVRELEDVWCFRCPMCRAAVALAKTEVGGTRGAGEKELT